MIEQIRRVLGLGPSYPAWWGRPEICAWIVERDSIDRPPFQKVSGEAAVQIGRLLDAGSRKHNVPLPFLLAVVRQESRFDPEVTNPNYARRTEENTKKALSFARRVQPDEMARIRALPEAARALALEQLVELLFTDWGLAQVSGRNLFAEQLSTRRALNPDWAVNRMAGRYRAELNWAKLTTFSRGGRPIPVDPLQAATMAYNRGRRGATLIIEQGIDPAIDGYQTADELRARSAEGWKHVRAVMGHYRRYLWDVKGVAA